MTVLQMHKAFKLRIDKVDSLAYPNFEDDEIDYYLNLAQERIIKQRYSINNIYKEGFETTQKRTDDLRMLIKSATILPSPITGEEKPNGVFFLLPNSTTDLYWFSIQEEVNITYIDCFNKTVNSRIGVKVIQHDDYNKNIRDPFNGPSNIEASRLMYQDKAELLSDGTFTINSYIIRYIRKPVSIDILNNIDCELADHIHSEIIEEAANIVLENIESKRTNTQPIILNKQE